MRVQRSIEIERAPDEVWPFLIEPEKLLEWYLPLQVFEYTSDQKSGVGASFRFKEETALGTMELECVVTEWMENEVFAFRMTSGNIMKDWAERWNVEATPSGSRFTFAEEGQLPFGILGKLIRPMAERGSGATVEKMLARLKLLAEA